MSIDVLVYAFNLRRYEEEALPAVRSLFDKGEPGMLIEILRRVASASPLMEGPEFAFTEDRADALRILEDFAARKSSNLDTKVKWGGVERSIRSIVTTNILPDVVGSLCLRRKQTRVWAQNMSKSPLVNYAYKHSHWIQGLFTFVEAAGGGALEYPIGESSELLTQAQANRLYSELSNIPEPQSDQLLSAEYDNFLELVKTALAENLPILLSVQ